MNEGRLVLAHRQVEQPGTGGYEHGCQSPNSRSGTSNLHSAPPPQNKKNIGRVIQSATKVMLCKFLVGNTAVSKHR